ncbi:hypothetical protein C8J57DRAFT_1514349 [Mycena rebaudengoi]|nr:hypothetical protein C8J57DRAFT_1514349 [Mycena rebaudengoi]
MSTTTGRTSEREGRVPTRRPTTQLEEGHDSVSSPQPPHGDSDGSDDTNLVHRPPAVRAPHVKITLWRLLNTTGLLVLSICKSILIFRGETLAPDHLDWSIGILWAFVAYWGSLIEQEAPSLAPWLFEDDLTVQVRGGFELVLFWLGFSAMTSLLLAWCMFLRQKKDTHSGLVTFAFVMTAMIPILPFFLLGPWQPTLPLPAWIVLQFFQTIQLDDQRLHGECLHGRGLFTLRARFLLTMGLGCLVLLGLGHTSR